MPDPAALTPLPNSRIEAPARLPATDPRSRRLQLACVTALTAEITARGHIPRWNCSLADRAAPLLARNAGFRLVGEYVHHDAGSSALQSRATA